MHWFRRTNFRERALLFPQRCSQCHVAANAASRGNQPFPAAGSGGFFAALLVQTQNYSATNCGMSLPLSRRQPAGKPVRKYLCEQITAYLGTATD